MPTTAPSELLARQHRQIDAGIQPILTGGNEATDALAESLDLLRAHLYLEETILFPPLEKTGLAMPIFVMKREHGEMWPLLESLTKACGAGEPAATLREPCRQLFQLLQIHNGKEEDVVYTAADRLASGYPDGALAETPIPVGWTCAMAPQA